MKQKIKKLIYLSGSKNAFTTLLNPTQYEKYPDYENLSATDKQKFNEFYKELSWELLLNSIQPVYEKYYNENEIDELINFYESPVGQKMINNSINMMSELNIMGSEFIHSMNNIIKTEKWRDYYSSWNVGAGIKL